MDQLVTAFLHVSQFSFAKNHADRNQIKKKSKLYIDESGHRRTMTSTSHQDTSTRRRSFLAGSTEEPNNTKAEEQRWNKRRHKQHPSAPECGEKINDDAVSHRADKMRRRRLWNTKCFH